MSDLNNMHCSVITSTTARMSEREFSQYQSQIPDWEIYKKMVSYGWRKFINLKISCSLLILPIRWHTSPTKKITIQPF